MWRKRTQVLIFTRETGDLRVFLVVGKLYAMKMLIKSEIEKRNQKIHTLAERQILENAKCPFIVQLHFAFQTEKKLYLVMDFMRGGVVLI